MFRDRVPARFLPIASDLIGDVICISTSGEDAGTIYLWDHELEADPGQGEQPDTVDNVVLIADGFDEFLDGLYEYQAT